MSKWETYRARGEIVSIGSGASLIREVDKERNHNDQNAGLHCFGQW